MRGSYLIRRRRDCYQIQITLFTFPLCSGFHSNRHLLCTWKTLKFSHLFWGSSRFLFFEEYFLFPFLHDLSLKMPEQGKNLVKALKRCQWGGKVWKFWRWCENSKKISLQKILSCQSFYALEGLKQDFANYKKCWPHTALKRFKEICDGRKSEMILF